MLQDGPLLTAEFMPPICDLFSLRGGYWSTRQFRFLEASTLAHFLIQVVAISSSASYDGEDDVMAYLLGAVASSYGSMLVSCMLSRSSVVFPRLTV
jgi:hypothetical protein